MANGNETNICFDCKKACGGCPWSAYDADSKKLGWNKIEGWEAKPSVLKFKSGKNVYYTHTYHITACPLFEADRE